MTPELIISIDPDLNEPASTRALKGTLDVDSFSVGGMQLDCENGVAYDLLLTNTGEGVVLSGEAACDAVTPCARCLKPARLHIEGSVEGYYVFDSCEGLEGYEDDEYETIAEDGTFDAVPAVMAAIVHATPYVVLCDEACAGLCLRCGADLNDGPCGCEEDDDVDPSNPFAVLKDYEFNDE